MTISANTKALKTALLEKGWSYTEFTEQADLSAVTVSKIVNGKSGVNPKTAKKMADALGRPVTELFIVK